ncbi:hypothetical protein DH2020_041165 [Rehmannia glutinosa]|uniref:Reverse transcriptase Ty1/copia-type domain-containing protein n=1 Tax=Rehmannia glutinosa TaxID=99300 RepID=A0ABR0US44_REHGL
MLPPKGYDKAKPGEVCHLQRSLYGLKQASRQWNTEFCNKLHQFGFTQSAHDHCLFIKHSADQFLVLLVYVDDVLVTGTHSQDIDELKQYLDSIFSIKDLGFAKYFLGMEIARNADGTALNQRKYILDILQDVGLLHCKPTHTPFPPGLKLQVKDGVPLDNPDRFRRLVGRLLYLNLTRPDITYAVQQLSQFVNDPYSSHWEAALHLLRFLKGRPSVGLFYSSQSCLSLEAYCDADWASYTDTRKSITGALQYATVSRPEISYSVNKVSQFMQSPLDSHWRAVKRILRYLAGTLDYGLHLKASTKPQLVAFSDADWASDPDDRRSTTGSCVFFGDNLIAWSSKKQRTVSRSSTEAEYRALAHVTCDVIWFQSLFKELKIPLVYPTTIWIDNQSAVSLANNPVFHSRTKHLEIDLHFIRDKIQEGKISVRHVPAIDQTSDIFTKPLSGQSFTRL